MTSRPRHPLAQSVPLAVLTLPLIFIGLGAWEMWRGWHTVSEVGDAGLDALVARLRLAPTAIAVLGGLVAGGAGLTGIGMVAASARRSARSRPALVASFHRVSRVLPLLLATRVVRLAIAMLGASVFEASGVWLTPGTDDRTGLLAIMGLVYAGLALWGGYATLRALRRALRLFGVARCSTGYWTIWCTRIPRWRCTRITGSTSSSPSGAASANSRRIAPRSARALPQRLPVRFCAPVWYRG